MSTRPTLKTLRQAVARRDTCKHACASGPLADRLEDLRAAERAVVAATEADRLALIADFMGGSEYVTVRRGADLIHYEVTQ